MPRGIAEYCYLLCADQPIGNPTTPHGLARHYIGSTDNLDRRIKQQRQAKPRLRKDGKPRKRGQAGARLVAAWNSAGIAWRVARVWKGGRELERALKARKKAAQLCPYCNGTRQRWQDMSQVIPAPCNILRSHDLPF